MKSKFDPQKHHRRSIRLKGFDYSSEEAYYVTIVVQQRDCLFGEIVKGEMTLNEYGKIVQRMVVCHCLNHFQNVELGAYVIMPNHVHGIIWIIDLRRGDVNRSPRDNPNKNILNENINGTSNQWRGRSRPYGNRHWDKSWRISNIESTKSMNRIETDKAITKFWQR